uniref:Uncharacterized protein n=1 Tax=Salmo trutta TaxID=8032 RepID=A0A674BPM6_SALTR
DVRVYQQHNLRMSVHTITLSLCFCSTEGGNAHIECPYGRGSETNQKYLSKGIYRDSVVVIQTQQHQHPAWTHQGRYSLYDDKERRKQCTPLYTLTGQQWRRWKVKFLGDVMLSDVVLGVLCDVMFSGVVLGVLGDVMFSGVGLGVLCDVMFSGVVLGVVLLLLGLLLFMFFRQRRDRDRRPAEAQHSTRPLVPDSMTTNQDPDTGTTTNPIYATATNQNPDTACDITTIYATATNTCPDGLYSNVDPACRHLIMYCTIKHSAT